MRILRNPLIIHLSDMIHLVSIRITIIDQKLIYQKRKYTSFPSFITILVWRMQQLHFQLIIIKMKRTPLSVIVTQHIKTYAMDISRSKRDVQDRKSTRLNSSHVKISYAVICLKK